MGDTDEIDGSSLCEQREGDAGALKVSCGCGGSGGGSGSGALLDLYPIFRALYAGL